MEIYKNNLLVKKPKKRLKNILKIIYDCQSPFIKSGDWQLIRPMRYIDIARIEEVNITTILRNIQDVAININGRIIPLKFIFSKKLEDGTSAIVIKYLVFKLTKMSKILNLNDHKITKIINNMGYIVSRRTINKYKKELKEYEDYFV